MPSQRWGNGCAHGVRPLPGTSEGLERQSSQLLCRRPVQGPRAVQHRTWAGRGPLTASSSTGDRRGLPWNVTTLVLGVTRGIGLTARPWLLVSVRLLSYFWSCEEGSEKPLAAHPRGSVSLFHFRPVGGPFPEPSPAGGNTTHQGPGFSAAQVWKICLLRLRRKSFSRELKRFLSDLSTLLQLDERVANKGGNMYLTTMGSVKSASWTFESTSFQAWATAWSFQSLRRGDCSPHKYVQCVHRLETHITKRRQ